MRRNLKRKLRRNLKRNEIRTKADFIKLLDRLSGDTTNIDPHHIDLHVYIRQVVLDLFIYPELELERQAEVEQLRTECQFYRQHLLWRYYQYTRFQKDDIYFSFPYDEDDTDGFPYSFVSDFSETLIHASGYEIEDTLRQNGVIDTSYPSSFETDPEASCFYIHFKTEADGHAFITRLNTYLDTLTLPSP